jgi:hypothetical protein
MPQAVPIIAAVASAGAAKAAAAVGLGAIASAVVGAVVATSIGAIGSALFAPEPPSFSLGASAQTQPFSSKAQGRSQIIRSPIETHKIIYGRSRVSGPLVFAETTDATVQDGGETDTVQNGYLHLVIPLAAHEVEEIETIYIDETPVTLDGSGFVTTAPWSAIGNPANPSFIRVKKFLGTDDQAASSDLVSEVSNWTENHRLRGIAYIYVRLLYDQDKFPNGLPNISAVVKGKKLYDPRTDTTAYSDNWALMVRDYLTNTRYGFGASDSEVDDTTINAAANICEESVTLADGSTQDRYTANGVVDTGQKPLDVLNQMLSGGAGTVTYSNGKYQVYAGAYDAPTYTITDDWLRGGIEVQASTPKNELFNTVRGVFVDPDNSWQPTDFPEIKNDTNIAEDNGEVLVRDVEFPFTTNPVRAQRLAKILLRKSRQGIVVNMPCNQKAMRLQVWDTVKVTNSILGWNEKIFRVVNWTFSEDLGVDLILKEEVATDYNWDAGEQITYDAAPNTNLPNAFSVQTPGSPTFTERLVETRGSTGVKAVVDLAAIASPDPFVERYQFRYKKTGESEYITIPTTTTPTAEIFDIEPGTYDFEVRAINSIGVKSDWVVSSPNEIQGLLGEPSPITGLTIQSISSFVILRWDRHPDLDVRQGGRIIFRHSKDGSTWAQSVSIGKAVNGTVTETVLPLKAGTYLARAVDSSGIQGEVATVSTAGATVLAYANVDSIAEHPDFNGVGSSVTVDTSQSPDVLKLAGAGQFDDIPDLDAVSNLDLYGGISTSGTYDFAAGIDLGTVSRIRLEANIKARTVDEFNSFDDRTELIDTWVNFDGDADGQGDCEVWVRTTDDDPSGSPVWSDYERLDVGEYNNRAFDFQARLSTVDSSYNIYVEELSVSADDI